LASGSDTGDHNLLALFLPTQCVLQDLSNRRVLAVAQSVDGLYRLSHAGINTVSSNKAHDTSAPLADFTSKAASVSLPSHCAAPSFVTLHARLGHTSLSKMQHLPCCPNNVPSAFTCDICVLAKMHRLPFNRSTIKSTHLFQLIHMDLWGPYKVTNITGAHYFLTIVDGFTRNTWTQLLQNKSQVKTAIFQFYNMVVTHFDAKIKSIRSDNGTEFINDFCLDFFVTNGILHQKSMVKNPWLRIFGVNVSFQPHISSIFCLWKI